MVNTSKQKPNKILGSLESHPIHCIHFQKLLLLDLQYTMKDKFVSITIQPVPFHLQGKKLQIEQGDLISIPPQATKDPTWMKIRIQKKINSILLRLLIFVYIYKLILV